MATKTIKIEITGKSPLLMNQYPMVKIEGFENKSKEDQAEVAAYRDPDTKELYIPAICIQRSLVNSATYSKGKGRASLQKVVAACVMIGPERIPLGTKNYSIDSRPVVIPATKGRIIKHRPRLNDWKCSFDLDYEDTLMKEDQIRKIVDDAGERVGLLDFRPERKGPFGRFMVTKWDSNHR